ncbi:hypothetical protein [Vulgatibacter sp.]|uniref:hypothetical protein n=1 Tax=Vulgatibacter sp. TaxID=1971226 RepID=UPI0035631815
MKRSCLLSISIAAAMFAASCGDEAPTSRSHALETCPGGGSYVEVEGHPFCAYDNGIIETGFRCPPEMPHAYEHERGVLCSPEGDLPAHVVDLGFEQVFGSVAQRPHVPVAVPASGGPAAPRAVPVDEGGDIEPPALGGGLPGRWAQTSGPLGVDALRLHGTDAGTLLVRTPWDLLRSTDGGVSWSPVDRQQPLPNIFAAELGGALYALDTAGDRLVASVDEGRTWSVRHSGWTGPLPFAGPQGALWSTVQVVSGQPHVLRKSTDGGVSWTDVHQLPAMGMRVMSAGGRLFASLGEELRVSSDGASWTVHPAPTLRHVDEFGGSLFATLADGSIARSDDGGQSWIADEPSALTPIQMRCGTYLAGPILFAVDEDGVHERGATGWSRVGPTWNGKCPTAAGGGTLWHFDYTVGEIARWDRSSGNWALVPVASPFRRVIDLGATSTVLLATDIYEQTFRSTDGGANWHAVPGLNLRRLASLGGGRWIGHSTQHGAVASADDGATWQTLRPDVWATAFAGLGSDLFMASVTQLERSSDGGATWTSLTANLPVPRGSPNINWIAVDGSNLYVLGTHTAWRSTDGGASFSTITDGTFSLRRIVRNGSTLVAAGELLPLGDYRGDFWISEDDGITWQRQHANLPGLAMTLTAVNGNVLATLARLLDAEQDDLHHVWRSRNDGATWSVLGPELPGLPTGPVVAGGHLWIGVDGAGVWKLPLP